jgi:nucleoside-diphosphate-sugar epimerase
MPWGQAEFLPRESSSLTGEMKVLVTGGSGRLGRAFCSFLADPEKTGTSVLALNLDVQAPPERTGAWFVQVDINSIGELYDVTARFKPEAIVHLAANPLPWGPPRHKQFVGNLGSTFAITQVACDLGVESLVLASSERAAGWSSEGVQPPHFPYDEDQITPTSNGYSLTKKLGEDVAAGLTLAHPAMRAVSLRLNYIITQGWKDPLPGEVASFHDRHAAHMWGYVRVEDACRALWAAVTQAKPGHRVYSIAARNSMTVLPIRELLAAKFGQECTVADWLPEYGAVVDSRRAERDLGWVAELDWRETPGPLSSP